MRFALPIVLVVAGIALFATAIPGTVLIDEHSYIATIAGLRDGTYRLPATDGLPPSPELLSFDAAPQARAVGQTPVATITPPLYAVLALPFSIFGVRGLIAMQVIAFVLCAWLVFRVVRRETERDDLAWFALAVTMFACFAIEYAQGIWPHATTMALVMCGVDCTSRLRREPRLHLAIAAGMCTGLAAGMRYQNIAIVVTLAASLWWVQHRGRALTCYVLGAAVPLLLCSLINASRLGTYNPVSKGARYLEVGRGRSTSEAVVQTVTSTWARVVDMSTWKAGRGDVLPAESGAFVLGSAVKKALLQSAPWVIVPLLALLAAWLSRKRTFERGLSIIVAGVLGMFALYGFRNDGWSFNPRYLLELMPLFASTLAIALVDQKLRWRVVLAGATAGAVLATIVIAVADGVGGQIALMKVPLVLAVVLAAAWLLRHRALPIMLGMALGWAVAIHVANDLPASRALRHKNAARLALADSLPDKPIALFTYASARDAYGPLLLEHDIVILDPWIDDARDAPKLLDALLGQGRTVYIDRALPDFIRKRLADPRVLELRE